MSAPISPTIRTTSPEDEPSVRAVLDGAGLDAGDLEYMLPTTLVAEIDGVVVATVALEDLGDLALLCSFAVVPEFRGMGLGRLLLRHAEGTARYMGFEQLFLLTETARAFFVKSGWSDLPRDQAPDLVKATSQFSLLCPESATLMTKAMVKA